MKYIRTKDKIYVESNMYKSAYYDEWMHCHVFVNVVKQADTIEELCDEFVTKVLNPNSHGTKPHGHYMNAMSFKDIVKYYLSSIEEKGIKTYDVYGAIWTEWGLKYVAKMNDKGEMELL